MAGGDAAKSTSLYGFAVAMPKIPPKQGQAEGAEFEGKILSNYSCPNLVMPKMEELISRPFVGQI